MTCFSYKNYVHTARYFYIMIPHNTACIKENLSTRWMVQTSVQIEKGTMALKTFTTAIEDRKLAQSSINFTHESTVYFFLFIVDLEWAVSSLTLSTTNVSSHCNLLLHHIQALLLKLSQSLVLFWPLKMINALRISTKIFLCF